jgi:hypothetical protein
MQFKKQTRKEKTFRFQFIAIDLKSMTLSDGLQKELALRFE